MLECIVYASTATAPVQADAISDLIHEARSFNEGRGITGLLVYCDLKFMQLIEGESDTLTGLYDRIRRDPRHTNVRLLFHGAQARRLFPTWSMALRNANDVSDAERAFFSNFLNQDPIAPTSEASDLPAMRLLEAFAETLRRRARIESALACLPA